VQKITREYLNNAPKSVVGCEFLVECAYAILIRCYWKGGAWMEDNALRPCAAVASYSGAKPCVPAIARGAGERNRTVTEKVTIVPKQIHQGNSITGSQLG
jgi:hypothetical protein